jgi:hypothetical protein
MVAAALLCPAMAVRAQDAREATYKVDFTIRDSGDAGGKAGRKYSMVLSPGHKTTFKVGNRVPVATGGTGNQFSYIDVGMNIECAVNEIGAKFAIHADLDVSTAVMPEKNAGIQNPTVSQIRLNLDTILTPGKPMAVASFDDPVTARKFDVDVAIAKM